MKAGVKNPLLPFLYRYLKFSPKFLLPKRNTPGRLPTKLNEMALWPLPGLY
jgi:hypothetical protein